MRIAVGNVTSNLACQAFRGLYIAEHKLASTISAGAKAVEGLDIEQTRGASNSKCSQPFVQIDQSSYVLPRVRRGPAIRAASAAAHFSISGMSDISTAILRWSSSFARETVE